MREVDRPDWNDFFEAYDKRVEYLQFARVILPLRFIQQVGGAEVLYQEAKLAYLYGLPNSSVAASVRCLEVGLRKAFEDREGKTARGHLVDLIDWSERLTGSQTAQLAHGFRLVRNLVHTTKLVDEADALAELLIELRPEAVLVPRVERGGAVVEQEHLRATRECARDRNALLLTAGQFSRIQSSFIPQSHPFKFGNSAIPGCLPAHLFNFTKCNGAIFQCIQMGVGPS